MSHAHTYHLYNELRAATDAPLYFKHISAGDPEALSAALAPLLKVIGVKIKSAHLYDGVAQITVRGERAWEADTIAHNSTGIDLVSMPLARQSRLITFSTTVE